MAKRFKTPSDISEERAELIELINTLIETPGETLKTIAENIGIKYFTLYGMVNEKRLTGEDMIDEVIEKIKKKYHERLGIAGRSNEAIIVSLETLNREQLSTMLQMIEQFKLMREDISQLNDNIDNIVGLRVNRSVESILLKLEKIEKVLGLIVPKK